MVALQTAKTTQETAMNHGTKTIALPELTANLLRDGGCLIDNLFADLWKQTGMKARLDRIGLWGIHIITVKPSAKGAKGRKYQGTPEIC